MRRNLFGRRILMLGTLALTPLTAGCADLGLGGWITTVWGSIVLWDLALTPVRTALGSAALNFVNTVTP